MKREMRRFTEDMEQNYSMNQESIETLFFGVAVYHRYGSSQLVYSLTMVVDNTHK